MDAIDKARKSLVSTEDTVEKSAEVEKTDPDVKAQEEATKSTEEAEKNVNQATISDDNEKVTKDVDDDDVEESADKKDKSTKSVDEAEKSEDEPAVEKNTDAKSEEAKAKQHKELTNVDDPKGHEEASKSFDTNAVIDALTKSVDTMAEMQKSYKELAEASMEIAKSFLAKQAPIEDQAEKSVEKHENDADIEKSVDKKCKTAKSDDDDDQEPDTDDEAKDDKEDKAKKSVEEPADNADEAEKSVEEPAEEDKAEKSIPTGKAVATGAEEAKDDTVAKSVETQEDGVTKEALENVIAKSLLGFDGVQSGVNLERKHALKSLLADTRELKGTTVPDSFIERYNEI